jgi:undecaprenyl-diphosphatase
MNWTRSLAIALLAAALGLSLLAATNDRLPGDAWLARHAQDLGDWFEPFAEAARAVTTTQTVLVLGVFLFGLLVWRGERRLGLTCIGVFAVLPLLQAGIKNVVDRPRPAADLVERRANFTSESFPSGHTMSGTVLLLLVSMALLALVPHRGTRLVAICLAAAVLAVSMIGDLYLGMHWPSDVLGGLLWGCAVVAGVAALSSRIRGVR